MCVTPLFIANPPLILSEDSAILEKERGVQVSAHFNDYLIYDMDDNMITPPYYR